MTNAAVTRQALPAWSPLDLAAALGPGPVAVLEGLRGPGDVPCALVAWGPGSPLPTLEDALAAADAAELPPDAPALLGAAVGAIDWDGTPRFRLPASSALFTPTELWVRGDLPPVAERAPYSATVRVPARPLWPRDEYCAAVRAAQARMAAGAVRKVILSVPFAAPCDMAPLAVFDRLRAGSPPGLRYLLDDGPAGGALTGISPEPLVTLTGRRAELHLLAGTRPLAAGMEMELLASRKDRAEHLVAVEQARRDLEAVCAPDSVLIEYVLALVHHPGLIHLASGLGGTLRADASPADLITACFPAGTVGGVPRAPAVALIGELEPIPRGWYAGAVGALLPGGDVQLWLTIRSLRLEGGVCTARTGAGLVPDSVPEQEWQECLNKARRTLAAAGAEVPPDGEI